MIQPLSRPWQRLLPGLSIFYLDDLRPELGNKGYKLPPILEDAVRQGCSTIVSVGGRWSNHILALAQLGNIFGLKTIGCIRGGAPLPLTATLQDAEALGMQLEFLAYSEYRNHRQSDFITLIKQRFPDAYFVPEGGSCTLGVLGAERIAEDLEQFAEPFSELYVPLGTGGTLAGLVRGLRQPCHVVGVSALKKTLEQDNAIKTWIDQDAAPGVTYELVEETRFGGYGRCPDALKAIMAEANTHFEVVLDPIYTSKCFAHALERRKVANDSRERLVLHTGGLQGRRGFDLEIGVKPHYRCS